jgi:hypothetical protein
VKPAVKNEFHGDLPILFVSVVAEGLDLEQEVDDKHVQNGSEDEAGDNGSDNRIQWVFHGVSRLVVLVEYLSASVGGQG